MATERVDNLHRGLSDKFIAEVTGGRKVQRVARRRERRAEPIPQGEPASTPFSAQEITVLPNGQVKFD